ncbi:MAG TPA: DUF1778 domain-containing protein [Hyphomicrobiaceae bacterium]|jgi:uncharacterized protein (DUF1778 family)
MAAAAKRTRAKSERGRAATINLRVPSKTRDLIDAAAAAAGKSRTEFMLDVTRQHAIDVLLDQRIFILDDAQFEAFNAVLANPPRANAQLKRLFASKSPWEK